VAGGEEAFAEVAGHDFFGVADGGEVDAGVPAEEYIDVRRYMLIECVVGCQSLVVGRWLSEKGTEEFGDAGGVHGNFDCRLPVGDLGEKCESGNPHPCKTRKDGAASVVVVPESQQERVGQPAKA